MDEGQPALGHRLVNAIDFADELKEGATDDAFAAQLMGEEVTVASERAFALRDPKGLITI